MLATLSDPILPVFMVMAAGYLLRRIGVMEAEHAGIINRYAFYLAVPALIVSVVATTPFLQIEWRAVAVYSSLQVGLALAGFAVLRLLFRIEMREAVLLGMATSFVNHVFFVLPIAERLVGPDAAMPMAGIVMVDAGFIFPMSVLLVARLSGGRTGQGRLAGLLFRNPFVYASPIGVAIGLMGDAAPAGLMTFMTFAGGSAAPVLLFTLGITLAGSSLLRTGGAVWTVVGLKLLAHPVLVGSGLALVGASAFTGDITLLVAAGPCGAMPFVIATQYGVATERLAKVVLISTLLSILSLAYLTLRFV